MNTNNAILIVLIIGLAIIGVLIFSKSSKTSLTSLTSPSPTQTLSQLSPTISEKISTTITPTQKLKNPITVDLSSINNNFNQSGTATLTERNGKTTVVLNLKTDPNLPQTQPAHIHKGSCPNPGEILYSLNDIVNGKSTTNINTTLQKLINQLPLAINVHESTAQIDVFTACGDISK